MSARTNHDHEAAGVGTKFRLSPLKERETGVRAFVREHPDWPSPRGCVRRPGRRVRDEFVDVLTLRRRQEASAYPVPEVGRAQIVRSLLGAWIEEIVEIADREERRVEAAILNRAQHPRARILQGVVGDVVVPFELQQAEEMRPHGVEPSSEVFETLSCGGGVVHGAGNTGELATCRGKVKRRPALPLRFPGARYHVGMKKTKKTAPGPATGAPESPRCPLYATVAFGGGHYTVTFRPSERENHAQVSGCNVRLLEEFAGSGIPVVDMRTAHGRTPLEGVREEYRDAGMFSKAPSLAEYCESARAAGAVVWPLSSENFRQFKATGFPHGMTQSDVDAATEKLLQRVGASAPSTEAAGIIDGLEQKLRPSGPDVGI